MVSHKKKFNICNKFTFSCILHHSHDRICKDANEFVWRGNKYMFKLSCKSHDRYCGNDNFFTIKNALHIYICRLLRIMMHF